MSFIVMYTDWAPVVEIAQAIDAFAQSSRPLIIAAGVVKSNIKSRSHIGMGYDQKIHKPYDPDYKKSKEKAGYDASVVNIRRSGIFLDSLTARTESRDSATLSPGEGQRKKAEGLEKKRKILGASKEDELDIQFRLEKSIEHIAQVGYFNE